MLSRAVAGFVLILSMAFWAPPAQAADALRLDTPSGYPVPRFVSLKSAETNCRTGPSFEHPVRYIFQRAGAPVLVVAESVDHWRKLRDPEGDECWVHQTTLRAQTHILTLEATELRVARDKGASVSARLGRGVLARIRKKKNGWLLVTAGDAKGWVAADEIWGGDALIASDPRN